ncbi:hypothetical protein Acy02nite_21600 [Actinoplanes cyaneus]|uniref:DUF4232 domain-containing protein n=1 Tax=Actinoplanes cyaneus TaxID=52696 RepID=A0A919M6D1_9ACTN|nr:DUF4232 domain-containing protein [Actinoplanes cyaneus]MCW2136574.1 Protein of unknown function (DUF4232) [Actinoplanes cyaneus]GID64279.1 hypothetical protein Acy02nite_21600 [Actinoplanes cyaneus]
MRIRTLMIAVPALLVLGVAAGCDDSEAPAAAPATTAPADAVTSAPATPAKATATTKPTTKSGSPSVAACRSADLKTTVTLQPDGTRTTLTGLVTLTNGGKSSCTLDGWVAISLVNAADEVVKVPTRKVNEPGPAETFTVKPGTSAFAGIKWATCGKADETCGVGNTLRYNLEASTDGPVAVLEGFPNPERSDITMKSLQIGTLQPSNQGVVAW